MATTSPVPSQTPPVAADSATAPASKKGAAQAKTVKPAEAAKAAKPAKPKRAAQPAPEAPHKREKLVRDSFTIPKSEYEALFTLKDRASRLAVPAKKSELLRAGVKALAGMSDASLLAALKRVPAIKTGRPAGKGPARSVHKGKDAGAARD